MRELTQEQKLEHQRSAEEAVDEVIKLVARQVDNKVLACMMFYRACQIFRNIHSVGGWSVEDVDNFTREAMKDMLVKLPPEQMPEHVVIVPGEDGQPATLWKTSNRVS